MSYCIEYFSPVTRGGGFVEIKREGKMVNTFSREEAEAIAAESNRKFKPLQYTVKEAK